MRVPIDDVTPETAEILAAQAKARGLSVDEYLRILLGVIAGNQAEAMAVEVMTAMESLGEDQVTPLRRGFSRRDIYFPED